MQKSPSWLRPEARGQITGHLTHVTKAVVALRRRPVLRNSLIALAVLATLSGVLFATGIAGSALAAVGIGGGSGRPDPSQLTTPEQMVNGNLTFPTPTIPDWKNSPTPPAVALPTSKTPAPGTEPSPTPTDGPAPQPSPTSGQGGRAPTTCEGETSGVTWRFSICPPVHGQRVTLAIADVAHPNAATNIVLNFGSCSGCTVLLTPQQGYHLDATGHESATVKVPSAAANSSVPTSGMIEIAGGPSVAISAASVQ